ncbi:MAG: ATP-binding cassette domain-containing protein [Clostridia bacterium]|nr:ATP-binding cassette domain-containing protein [Clostridia bacterium]
MIEIKNLEKTYPSKSGDVVALKDINLTVEDGDIYGIIGLSGAGKSTLVRCINLLEKPTSGQILIDGEDLTKVTKNRLLEIRKKVSMIFQHFNLLQQRSVLKNVELAGEIAGDKNPTERAKELLKLVGLEDRLNYYPSQLSGGQQQRVAIARALMSDPKILLCDEATSALDPETTHSILELLKTLNKKLGLTIVIISHQMSVIESICNKVAIIDKSQIVSCGYLKDVFLSPTNEVAKKLIYSGHVNTGIKGEKFVKLMFTGEVDKPIVANVISELKISVSIMYAETKVINDTVCGQVIFRLPSYNEDIKKLTDYLTRENVPFEEVDSDALY